jgi:hypothetical protein
VADEASQTNVDDFNPYRPPAAEVIGQPAGGPEAAAGEPTETMVRHLRDTGPWALFLAIMGFIGCGVMLLSGLSSLLMTPVMQGLDPNGTQPFVSGIFVFVGVFYVIDGASVAIVSYYLTRYSQSISRVVESRTLGDVERALATQHRFWRALGIVTIGLVVLTLLVTVGFAAYLTSMIGAFQGGS